MKIPKLILLCLIAGSLSLLAACKMTGQCNYSDQPLPKAKYVFLLIGDGFGANQRIVANAASPEKLTMTKFPGIPTRTDNIYDSTTDSAASGTAIACGIKTYNGAVGVDVDGNPVESLAKKLHKQGFKVGLISNCPLTDATPAVHYATQANRGMQAEIGQDMANSGFEFFGGSNPGVKETYDALEAAGYKIIRDPEQYDAAVPGEKVYMNKPPHWDWFGEPSNITLGSYLRQAIRMLDNPDGFFIMVENGYIDYSGHSNVSETMLREVQALDDVLKVALEFYEQHPEDTLIVLTADHETGGLELLDTFNPDACSILWEQRNVRSVFASELQKLATKNPECLNDGSAIAKLEEDFLVSFDDKTKAVILEQLKKGDFKAATTTAAFARDLQLGFRYTGGGHTSAKILTSAIGVGSCLFPQEIENSDIPWLIGAVTLGGEEFTAHLDVLQKRAEAKARRELFSGTESSVNILPASLEQSTVKVCGKNFDLVWPEWDSLIKVENGSADGVNWIVVNNTSEYPLPFSFTGLDAKEKYFVSQNGVLIAAAADQEAFAGQDLAAAQWLLLPKESAEFLISTDLSLLKCDGQKVFAEPENVAFPKQKRFAVTVTNDVPVIDGQADDVIWQQVKAVDFVNAYSGAACKEPGTVKVAADPELNNLYVFAEFQDEKILADGENRDDMIFGGDTFEIILSTNDTKDFWQVAVNPNGCVFDQAPRLGFDWNGEYACVSRYENGKWIVEMAIPVEQFGFSAPLHVNFCHQNLPQGELSAVIPNGGSFGNVEVLQAVELVK